MFKSIYIRSLPTLLAMLLLPLSAPAVAMSDESLFQHARESYAAKNEIALSEDAAQLKVRAGILAL